MSTIPSTLAPIVNSYTPSVQSPAFSGPINEVLTPTTFAAGAQVLTAAELLGGLIVSTPTAAVNYTLPTAATLIPLIQGAQVGSTFRFGIVNLAAAADTITLTVGTGATLTGTTAIAGLTSAEFLVRVTSLGDVNAVGATYTIYGNF